MSGVNILVTSKQHLYDIFIIKSCLESTALLLSNFIYENGLLSRKTACGNRDQCVHCIFNHFEYIFITRKLLNKVDWK